MNTEDFRNLGAVALNFVQGQAPNPNTRGAGYYKNAYGNWQKCSTGNLAFNATKIEHTDERTSVIYVDDDIAPYMKYTNEPWISSYWKGHKNPNEGWFGRVAKDLATYIATAWGGVVMEYVSFGD